MDPERAAAAPGGAKTGTEVEVRSVRAVYEGWVRLLVMTLERDGRLFDRHVEDHGHAVAVLPYDAARRTVLLVRQPRAPVLFMGEADMLEAIAGRVEDEEPESCVVREAWEEAGVELGELEHVARAWTMPSLSTEQIDYYLAPYSTGARLGPGGGGVDEDEYIEVVEADLAEIWSLVEARRLRDGKALTLLQALRIRHPDLFE